MFVLTILTAGMLGMLWINTTLAQGAFTLTDLQQQRAQLIEIEQQLTEQLARADAPAQLEQSARALGMVPQDVPVFLRLEDGQVLGDPVPQPAPTVDDVAIDDVAIDDVAIDDVAIDEGIVEEVLVDEPGAEQGVVEEPVADEVTVDEVVVEEPIVEEPIVEEPAVDEVATP